LSELLASDLLSDHVIQHLWKGYELRSVAMQQTRWPFQNISATFVGLENN
jgi:hypothetical protein